MKLLYVVWGCLLLNVAFAQHASRLKVMHFKAPVCKASGKVEKSEVPPPAAFLQKSAHKKAEIVVDYLGFTDEAQAAFQYAVDIWETLIESDVPIRMQAVWSSELGDNVLGSCGPETFYANFEGAPRRDWYYPVAVAEKIAGRELNGESRYDMLAEFNSKIDWYLGTDRQTPIDKYDLVSVVLHEIGHGLGFTGFFFVEDNTGAYGSGGYGMGTFTPFDWMVEQFTGIKLVDTTVYRNPSPELKSALESSLLFANSPVARYASNGERPRLYAPSTYDEGSSIYHLNDASYPHGNENSLMTHAVGSGEAVHDPGPLTIGILEDLGWTNLFLKHEKVKDQESRDTVEFSVLAESYYPLDSTSLRVIVSEDAFTSSDTLRLGSTSEPGRFTVRWLPSEGITEFDYFITVSDQRNRIRTAPSDAPAEKYHVLIGPDHEAPVISHVPIPYFLTLTDSLILQAEVTDNLGVDTVMVHYQLNGGEQQTFGLKQIEHGLFRADFPFRADELEDGDVVSYQIEAIDASEAANRTTFPKNNTFSFRVERVFQPLSSYSNNFDKQNRDFLLYDFEVRQEASFSSPALHSPHPYPSPNMDNAELEFSTMLKYPIIINANGILSFDEVVLVEPGSFDQNNVFNLWDYVVVEASKDWGTTWKPLVDPYDAGVDSAWEAQYEAGLGSGQDSKTSGAESLFVQREINLSGNGNFAEGDTVLIRFRLYSDPYANGWGWAIDNLRIQQLVAAHERELSFHVQVYPNPVKERVTVKFDAQTGVSSRRLEVLNMLGQQLVVTGLTPNAGRVEEYVDMSGWNPGMYLLRLIDDGRVRYSQKLIKN